MLVLAAPFVAGLVLALLWRRSFGVLSATGLALAALLFAVGWVRAPRSPHPCADCGYSLGRYWELQFFLFVLGVGLALWVVGVAVGRVARR